MTYRETYLVSICTIYLPVNTGQLWTLCFSFSLHWVFVSDWNGRRAPPSEENRWVRESIELEREHTQAEQRHADRGVLYENLGGQWTHQGLWEYDGVEN